MDGPTGRRRWLDDVEARIVAESLEPGAQVCDVAAKYGLIARHLSQSLIETCKLNAIDPYAYRLELDGHSMRRTTDGPTEKVDEGRPA